MRVRVVLLTEDSEYASRLTSRIKQEHGNDLSLDWFSNKNLSLIAAQNNRADILLVEESVEVGVEELPRRCLLLYLTEHKDIESINGIHAVFKWQSVSSLFLELKTAKLKSIDSNGEQLKAGERKEKIIVTFVPGTGGAGSSVAAASCALVLAKRGENVLYLNLEKTGLADIYFSADGKDDFGTVLYALARDNGTLPAKIDNAVRLDYRGVFYFASCQNALDMTELTADKLADLFKALGEIKKFDWIIVDMDSELNNIIFEQIERSYATVVVSDGSESGNGKTKRWIESLLTVSDQRQGIQLSRIFLLYNRFASKSGQMMDDPGIESLGGINRFENANLQEMLEWISENKANVFEKVIEPAMD